MLYRDDFEAARARAEALERAVARSLHRLVAVEGAMEKLERRLGHALVVGNWLIVGAGAAGFVVGVWIALSGGGG